MLPDRFWNKVFGHSDPTKCWIWTASHNGREYGLYWHPPWGRRGLAHRVSYEDRFGPIPAGMHCLHRCDNPRCVNPDHLFLGTNTDNIADRVAKKRSNKTRPDIAGDQNWTRKNPDKVLRGASIGTSKYSEAIIRTILEARCNGVGPAEIVRTHKLPKGAVDNILAGNSWAHIHREYADSLRTVRATPKRIMTAETAAEVRRRLASGETGRALAVEYGISFQTVSEIKTGKIWKT